MFIRRISIFAVSLLIAHGCATVPRHDLAQKMTSLGCQEVVLKALDKEVLPEGEWPEEKWWENYQDTTLNYLISTALENSPTLKRAEARLKASAQVALQKKAKLYPEVDFDADDNWQHLSKHGLFREFDPRLYPPVINQIDLGFNFTYEFDFWGKNRDLFHAALGRAAAQLAEKKQAELILVTSIAYTYFQAQFLLRKLEVLEELETNRQKILEITKKRELNALATNVDQLNASSFRLDFKAQIFETEQNLRIEIHKLKALSGLGQDIALDLSWKPVKNANLGLPKNLCLDLIARRPDLRAQTLRVEAAAKEIGAAKTNFYPNFNLSGILGLESLVASALFQSDSFNANLEPAVHLPIFTAGRLKAQLFEKVANFNEAVYSYNELILLAAQQVADSLSNIALLKKQIAVRVSVLENAENTLKHAAERFKNALDNQISFLNAENSFLQEELSLTQLQYSNQLVEIQLIRALGGGYHND